MSIESVQNQIKEVEIEEIELCKELGLQESGLSLRTFGDIMRDLDRIEVKLIQLKETLESYEGGV